MTRTLIALVLGVLVGVGATLWLARASLTAADPDAWPRALPATAPSPNVVAPAAVRETTRDFYRRLADADATELATMIAQTASQPPSADRDLALAVLLKRYAELDAVRAVRLARELRVGGAALGAVYGAWARTAPDQVFAALSTVDRPEDAASVALALIAALGDDAAAVKRVAAVLASREGEAPLAGVVPPIGPGITPAGPFGLAQPRSALMVTAQRWADLDPRRALAATRAIDDEHVRLAFETAALRALAPVAPDEVFAHLASLDASAVPLGALTGTLVELARADPARVLDVARNLPPDVRRMAESAALQQLAERDPLAALRYAERMPMGPERQGLMQVVARQYGKRDTAAALAWAREQPGQPMLVATVIAGVAEQDVDRALDLALGLASPMERRQAVQFAAMMGAAQDSTAEAMANRLLAVDDPEIRDNLGSMVVGRWASRSPDNAMRWLLANAHSVSQNVFQNVGQQLAMRDPQNALTYSAHVPPAARERWIHGVALGYAQTDPHGAVGWLGQYRGEQWYGRAASTVAMVVAQRDGAAAARLVDEIDTADLDPQERRLVNVVATNWANTDPTAAADWSTGRPTQQEREVAVQGVVGVWSGRDVDAARQWTLRLPQGALRDAALAPLLRATARQGSGGPDASLLNAFASDGRRQVAVLQVVQVLANDVTRARAIADAHLSDPNLRAQAERFIEAARNGPRRPIEFGVTQSGTPIVTVR
jgi:hypothetical protein